MLAPLLLAGSVSFADSGPWPARSTCRVSGSWRARELTLPAMSSRSLRGRRTRLQTGWSRSNLADECRRLPRPIGKRFEMRRTAPPRYLTFTSHRADCSQPPAASADQWLHSKSANWNSRPTPVVAPVRDRTFNGDRFETFVYWTTSSARSSNDCGIVIPSALAVLRLITRLNRVGCSMGRSPGLAPFKIRSTYRAPSRANSSRVGP